MSSKAVGTPLALFTRHSRPRPSNKCLYKTSPRAILASSRQLSTSESRSSEGHHQPETRPRWQYTPERMKAPVSLRAPNPGNNYYVNEDPQRLDTFYKRMLGANGDKLLTEEVKWLAVTHKSFDQGRRGYNDRLAFLGKRIVDLQASLALLGSSQAIPEESEDPYGREPFRHPSLEGLPRLTTEVKKSYISQENMAGLAVNYGLLSVLRWKPRFAHDLAQSGSPLALTQALYAIVGAVSLQNGADVANEIVREKILAPLGLK